jgi:predicted TIM-barrel fold metal-dependent hydrolase
MSQNRREFLAAAGTAAALKSAELGRDDESIFCVDVQSHFYVPDLVKLMESRRQSPYAYRKGEDIYCVVDEWHRRLRPNHQDPAAKLADMDGAGIQITLISTNDPGPERFGEDGVRAAHIIHDFLHQVSRQYPGRFVGLATLPLQDMAAALAELDRCVDQLGFRGILLYSNLAGQFPDEPQFRPLFSRAEAMGIPILLHPAYPMTYEQTKGHQLTGGLGLMFDTTIALARLILAGILDEFPQLKLLCPHVGGALPFLIGRLDHQTQVLKRGADHIKKPPSEYLKQIYLDTVSPFPMAIRYGYDFVGPDQLLYASDHPWVDPKLIAGCVRSLELPTEHERKIFGLNAKALFNL